jgi:8-oxo-dGTP pyrophosphatase MutT (NUDIX family)
MTTITINGTPVPVTVGDQKLTPADAANAAASLIFCQWQQRAELFGQTYPISEVRVTAVNYRGAPSSQSVLFVRMDVAAANVGHPQIVELRGGTCVMLPVIECEGLLYTILVRQPRIAVGDPLLREVPAGMIDGGTFDGAAAREIAEELQIEIAESDLVPLCREPIFLSPGLLDEDAMFYVFRKSVDAATLASWQGKATGAVGEGERITLEIIPFYQLQEATRDAKAIIAYALYAKPTF